MTGCATNGDPRDPLEPLNRSIQSFNTTVDDVALRPIAKGYEAVVPSPLRTGVRNFFSNLDDVAVLVNNLMQFKGADASSDALRLAFNSTLGFFGVLDIATEMGLKKHNEDFGQTLGYWGLGTGPYLVLPILGPSNFRDTAGWAVDSLYTDLVAFNDSNDVAWPALSLRLISRRADLLDATRAIEMAALDTYEFTRDIYLERRRALVYDGKPPEEDL